MFSVCDKQSFGIRGQVDVTYGAHITLPAKTLSGMSLHTVMPSLLELCISYDLSEGKHARFLHMLVFYSQLDSLTDNLLHLFRPWLVAQRYAF